MKKIVCAALLMLGCTVTFSQNVYSLQDPVSSKNFNAEKYSGIRGTPFLVDKWTMGSVTTPKGIYQHLELKFNVYDNTLFFNKNDESFEFLDEIVSFTLMPKPDDASSYMTYKKGISGADLRGNEFVQVLLEGTVGLYKLDLKQLSEMSEINAGIVKTFTNNSKYYISRNKQLQFVKLNKAEIIAALSDKQDKIQAYINEKKYSFRKDAELVDVLKYYSSL
ncbi:MAG: hypothetical protein V4450_11480 [Bacteroidota bacterium]